MFDSPKPAVSTSPHALSLSSALQKDETEHEDPSEKGYDREDEDADGDDVVLESDSARFVSLCLVLDQPLTYLRQYLCCPRFSDGCRLHLTDE